MPAKFLDYLRRHHIALLALFVALGGTSYAAATGSIDSREIKNNTVRSKDIRNNSLRSKDVRNRSLLAKDFKPGQLPAGPTGPPGSPGPTGPTGPTGRSGAPGTARAFAKVVLLGDGTLRVSQAKGVSSENFVRNAGNAICVRGLPFTPQNIVGTPEPSSPQHVVAVFVPAVGCGAVPGAQAELRFLTGSPPVVSAGSGYFLIN